jgi:N utilization substance protein B
MSARSKARKRALDVLYEAELRGETPATVMTQVALRRKVDDGVDPHVYTEILVEGVVAHQERIDEILSTYSQGWTLERMPVVDRNVLRLGVFELLWRDDVPDSVAIDEAVELAKSLSTDESPSFVNGLLARVVQVRATLDLSPE